MKYKQASIFGIKDQEEITTFSSKKVGKTIIRRKKAPQENYVIVTRIPEGTSKEERDRVLTAIKYMIE